MLENISVACLRHNITYMWYNDAQREPSSGINTHGDWIISWKPQLASCASKLSNCLREQKKPDLVTISINTFANWHVQNLLYAFPLYFCKPACTKFTLCVSFILLQTSMYTFYFMCSLSPHLLAPSSETDAWFFSSAYRIDPWIWYNTVRFQISYNVRVTNCQFWSWLWTTNIQRHANNKPHIDTGCSNSGSTYMPRLKPLNNTRHYIYLLVFFRATAVKHICIFFRATSLKHSWRSLPTLKYDALPVGNVEVWDLNGVWSGLINSLHKNT
jgi:hypothetical protein